MINIIRVTNSKEDNLIWIHSLISPKEDSQIWIITVINSPITQDQGGITLVKIKVVATSTGLEKGIPIDLVDLGVELLVEIEKLPGIPGRRVTCLTTAEIMTLAMGDIIENTARRPCIMGGHL